MISFFFVLLYKCCEINVAWSRSDLIWNNKFNAKRVSCIRVTIAENGFSVSSCAADIIVVYYIRVLNVALYGLFILKYEVLKRHTLVLKDAIQVTLWFPPVMVITSFNHWHDAFQVKKNTVHPSHQEKANPKYPAWECVFCRSTFSTLGTRTSGVVVEVL